MNEPDEKTLDSLHTLSEMREAARIRLAYLDNLIRHVLIKQLETWQTTYSLQELQAMSDTAIDRLWFQHSEISAPPTLQ